MIFSISDHIEQIKAGTKTQTRRPTNKYKEDRLYAIQPGRGKPRIPEGKIYVLAVSEEYRPLPSGFGRILKWQAESEGGYTPEAYEELYEKMYPGWEVRYAYLFEYFTTKEIELISKGDLEGVDMYLSRTSKELRKANV